MAERDIYIRIEAIEDYSPVEPDPFVIPPLQYKRDGMYYPEHPMGVIPDAERDARALRAVVYREYLDADYLIPRTTKIVNADINEPVWSRNASRSWCIGGWNCRRRSSSGTAAASPLVRVSENGSS